MVELKQASVEKSDKTTLRSLVRDRIVKPAKSVFFGSVACLSMVFSKQVLAEEKASAVQYPPEPKRTPNPKNRLDLETWLQEIRLEAKAMAVLNNNLFEETIGLARMGGADEKAVQRIIDSFNRHL